MAKAKYKVLDPVEHNKKRYEVGAEIELDEVDAAPLLALKAIAEAEIETKKK
jgi:hypothetical protein